MVKTKNNKTIKKIDKIINFLNYMDKPHIKILNLVYYFILLIIFLTLLLQGYNYSVLNVEFIRDFKNNNAYLTSFLLFIVAYLLIKIIVDPIHDIGKVFMYKLPKITFTVYSLLLLYIIYNTYNIQNIFVNM